MSARHDASVSWLRSHSLTVRSGREFPSPAGSQASESPGFHGIVRAIYQPPEKPTACANEPKPPRVTWLDPESEVPEADWLDEEPPE